MVLRIGVEAAGEIRVSSAKNSKNGSKNGKNGKNGSKNGASSQERGQSKYPFELPVQAGSDFLGRPGCWTCTGRLSVRVAMA
ncbi:hypothetical protein KFS84_15345 [Xanthomonas translucens pv. graminis]|uniref:hypothetical protein n=1 Tax=Xanthomonas graminis TaxID=3390026 RepID=UPI001F1BA567|nr:hypothetical protein [Xanthomonas translucens]UKE53643.1 hypothetical protein KFS84_15345 [Xanthomonas translucens pv. graminis]